MYDSEIDPSLAKLPIGIQAFETLRGQGYLYVDKTRWVHRMVTQGMFYFLARPRRFGKSLLVSTLKCLFEGRKELFEGLWIAAPGRWDWQAHPVIHLSFTELSTRTPALLEQSLSQSLEQIALDFGVTLRSAILEVQFQALIRELHAKTGAPVAVLIDEYDKPLLDHLGQGEAGLAIARANRELLRSFFGVLKGAVVSPLLRFVFLTGVSRFSRVSIFSELNNLQDLSMNDAYADMLGYTQEEIETYFGPHITRFARLAGLTPAAVTVKLAQYTTAIASPNGTCASPIPSRCSTRSARMNWATIGLRAVRQPSWSTCSSRNSTICSILTSLRSARPFSRPSSWISCARKHCCFRPVI